MKLISEIIHKIDFSETARRRDSEFFFREIRFIQF